MGLRHRFEDRIRIHRLQGAQVDDLGLDAILRQRIGGGERLANHPAVGDDGEILALAHDVRLADGDFVGLFRHHAAVGQRHLVHHREHRIVVPRRGDQETLGVIGRGRRNDLQARQVAEPRFQALGVLRGQVPAAPGHGYHRDGQLGGAAEHVAHLGHLVGDLVHALAHEVHEHDVDDGSQAGRGRTDAQAHDAFLRDGRVDHALRPELLQEPPVGAEHAPGAADVLAGDEGVVLFE